MTVHLKEAGIGGRVFEAFVKAKGAPPYIMTLLSDNKQHVYKKDELQECSITSYTEVDVYVANFVSII